MPIPTTTPSLQDLKQQVEKKDKEIQDQLDRIYTLVGEGKPAQFVQIEYKRAVERMTEKYTLLLSMVDMQKEQFGEQEHTDRAQALRDQYKEDIVVLAVAIDEAMQPGSSAPTE